MWEKLYKKQGIKSQREYPNESLIAFIKQNIKKGSKVLELGCGSGANMWFLAKEGMETYGIDYAPKGIEYCKEILKKWNVEADIKVGDMRKLEYKNELFDAIVDIVSLQHVKEKKEVMEEVYRCLKPNGRFFSYHIAGGNIKELFPDYTFYFPTEIKIILEKARFKEIKIDKVLRTYNNQEFNIEYLVIKAKK